RSGDGSGLAEAAHEANRRAQEMLDRAVRAESELTTLREQLTQAPVGDSKEAEHRVPVLEEQLRTVEEERDRATADPRTLGMTARDTEARAEELAQREEDLTTSMDSQSSADPAVTAELHRTIDELKVALAES